MKLANKLKWPGLEELVVGILLIIITVAVCLQVFNRYLIGASIPWTEELARYCFLWLTFIGTSLGVKKSSHLSVDLIRGLLREKGNKTLSLFVYLIFLTFCLVVVIAGLGVFQKMMQFRQASPGLGIQMGYVYLSVPVGLALTSFRIIQKIMGIFKGKEKSV